ncbi:hypothetical protein OC844_007498, partial [Tilletia horrida]
TSKSLPCPPWTPTSKRKSLGSKAATDTLSQMTAGIHQGPVNFKPLPRHLYQFKATAAAAMIAPTKPSRGTQLTIMTARRR